MATLYTAYAAHGNATITVTNTAELNQALAQLTANGGGTIQLDGNGGPYSMFGKGVGGANAPILIEPLDVNNPPTMQTVDLRSSSYVTFTGLNFDSSGLNVAASNVTDIKVLLSNHIEFVDNVMSSVANGYLTGTSGSATKGAQGATFTASSDIVFSHNTMTNYYHGLTLKDITGLTFTNNDISGIQGDGLRGGGIQNAVISNNYMHDFYGSVQTVNHTDMIQIWGTNVNQLTQNVVISGNVLESNGGAASQAIYMNNTDFGKGAYGGYFTNVQVYDNVIYNGTPHGISISDVDGLNVYNNTVLWDQSATLQKDPSAAPVSRSPQYIITNVHNASVVDNVGSKFMINGAQDTTGNNLYLDYSNPSSPSYINKVITDIDGSLTGSIDLSIIPVSAIYGVLGASMSSDGLTTSTGSTVTPPPTTGGSGGSTGGSTTVDPVLPSPTDTPEPTAPTNEATNEQPSQPDSIPPVEDAPAVDDTPPVQDPVVPPSTTQGPTPAPSIPVTTTASYDPATYNVDFDHILRFEGNLDDDADSSIKFRKDMKQPEYVDGDDGKAYHLSGNNSVKFERGEIPLHKADSFFMSFDLQRTDAAHGGNVMHLNNVLQSYIDKSGYLHFDLTTDQGTFSLVSDEASFDDTEWHNAQIIYDSDSSTLAMMIDGDLSVLEGAQGTTIGVQKWGLSLGHSWRSSIDANIDNFIADDDVPHTALFDTLIA